MKIVCDVCGTTFPETETNCPICGCAKAADAQMVEEEREVAKETTSAAAYAKGGRFAKNNVRRSSTSDRPRSESKAPQEGNNIILITIVIVLLLAIVGVVCFIGYSLFDTYFGDNGSNNSQQVTDPNQNPGDRIPCTGITLRISTIELNTENEQVELIVETIPANTTDKITYVSSDPDVAIVTNNGTLTMVTTGTKQGEATITVTCGDFSAVCTVISNVGESPVTQPTTPPGPVLPEGFVLKLNRDDFTLSKEGETWDLLRGIDLMGLSASDISWTTSDPLVATVENGIVSGVNRGNCTITATIGDQTVTCIVRCGFDAAPPSDYELNIKDVTIGKGDTVSLSLKHKETGANVQGLVWTADKSAVSINGNKVTGGTVSTLTNVTVTTEYEGITYTVIIRVKAA